MEAEEASFEKIAADVSFAEHGASETHMEGFYAAVQWLDDQKYSVVRSVNLRFDSGCYKSPNDLIGHEVQSKWKGKWKTVIVMGTGALKFNVWFYNIRYSINRTTLIVRVCISGTKDEAISMIGQVTGKRVSSGKKRVLESGNEVALISSSLIYVVCLLSFGVMFIFLL